VEGLAHEWDHVRDQAPVIRGEQETARLTQAQVAQFAIDASTLAAKLDDVERVGNVQAKRLIIERLIAGVRVTTDSKGKARRWRP